MAIDYKEKFYGYVDLSQKGDILEAMFNLYNIFHQTDSIDCKKIFIYDFSHIINSESIWDKIIKASENKIISIPRSLLI